MMDMDEQIKVTTRSPRPGKPPRRGARDPEWEIAQDAKTLAALRTALTHEQQRVSCLEKRAQRLEEQLRQAYKLSTWGRR
jgi:hypothetical protein